MSVLGKIAKIGAFAAPFALAPFTGGASLGLNLASKAGTLAKVAGIAGKVAPVLGGMAKGSADSRKDQANYNATQDRNNLLRYQLQKSAPMENTKTAVRGSMVKNASPVTAEWGGPGSALTGGRMKFSGGYANPNLISPEARQVGEDATHQAMVSSLTGGKDIPGATPYPKEGLMSKIMGGAAAGSSLMGAFGKPQGGRPMDEVPMPTPKINRVPMDILDEVNRFGNMADPSGAY